MEQPKIKKQLPKSKFMMATNAIHQLGDISSDEPDICVVHEEDDDNYYGNWVTGFGFIGVRFPKETTRSLTKDEIEHYKKQRIFMSNGANVGLGDVDTITPADIIKSRLDR